MKVEFINPFLESILNVLNTMAMFKATPGKPAIKKNQIAKGDVTGLIGMAGEQARGTLAITFPEGVILEITKRMLGEELTGVDDTVTDMVGEITNMVTGGAKRILSEQGYRFDMAIPSVVAGKDHSIQHKSKSPVIIVPFSTECGDFFIEICFEE
ncbi:MAG: chemotaxis protein CheX [Deltaproteobacteria bacterium]|nr:chemotaxis protein CheX [Deltaproteobacteria bacterium]